MILMTVSSLLAHAIVADNSLLAKDGSTGAMA